MRSSTFYSSQKFNFWAWILFFFRYNVFETRWISSFFLQQNYFSSHPGEALRRLPNRWLHFEIFEELWRPLLKLQLSPPQFWLIFDPIIRMFSMAMARTADSPSKRKILVSHFEFQLQLDSKLRNKYLSFISKKSELNFFPIPMFKNCLFRTGKVFKNRQNFLLFSPLKVFKKWKNFHFF